MNRISCLAKGLYKSTEDVCKSTNLYRMWDQRHMIRNWRHASWALLRDHNVLCAIWLDEILAFHGAEFPLGDYCLLVNNPRIAAGILSLYGYQTVSWRQDQSVLRRLNCERIKMSAPGAKIDIVLLSAAEWCYDLSFDALHDDLCPYLPEFIDAMIEIWLRVRPDSFMGNSYLMNFLADTIQECYKLNDFGEDVCENDYAVWLNPNHHEVHFDIVARSNGLVKGHLDFQSRHRYHVHKSDLIKQGKFRPQPRKKRFYSPRLPSLPETLEECRPQLKRAEYKPIMLSAAAIKAHPQYAEIGVAV